MKIEVVLSDDDQNNMKILLDAFGSAVSLEDIASAYCEAGRDLNSTAEMLCNMQGSISATSLPISEEEPENTDVASCGSSSSIPEKGHIAKLNSKKCSASIGTVSSVIGKGYLNHRPEPKGLNDKKKPIKLSSNDFPVTQIWGEEKESTVTTQGEPMDNDLGEFLFKMLGRGFQLEMGVIQQVIGQCGYDMPKSIDKLLDISAASLDKSDDVIGVAAGNNIKNNHDVGSTSGPKQSQLHYSGRSKGDADEPILPRTERKNLQKEVSEALFSASDRIEDHHESTRPVRTLGQSPHGRILAKPPQESLIDDFTFMTRKPIDDRSDETNEENYEELRKAVTENWVTMKEYYKASVDAFIKGDPESAQNLLEQGDFYKSKAREADERSTKNLTGNNNKDEEFCINVHHFAPKDALYHTKLHLTTLCAVRLMKVVVGTSGDKKDVRRKCLITKLLEGKGIPWTEEGDGWIISIRVDEIDPIKLISINK